MSNKHMRLLGSGRDKMLNRQDNDYYPTPPFVTNALCRKFGGPYGTIPKKIWEPAAGRGWMAQELIRNGHEVVATELFEYEDPLCDIEWNINYLDPSVIREADAIITNPPYEKKFPQEFAQKAIDLKVSFIAILCRLLWVEASGRYDFFTKTPPSDILMMAGRFSCQEKKFDIDPLGGMVSYAWFVWDRMRTPHDIEDRVTRFHWTNCKDELNIWKQETSTTIEQWIG
jgi:hypothetical protein